MNIQKYINLDSLTQHHIDDHTWYKVADVGEALGYAMARKALYKLMDSHQAEFEGLTLVTKLPIVCLNPATGQEYTARRNTLLINKQGIITILMYSSLSVAQEFRRDLIQYLAD